MPLFLPETKVTRPTGGPLLWVEMPKHVDSRDYFYRALSQGISVVPGLICCTFDKYKNFIRLTCSGVWNKDVEKGIATLGELASRVNL